MKTVNCGDIVVTIAVNPVIKSRGGS